MEIKAPAQRANYAPGTDVIHIKIFRNASKKRAFSLDLRTDTRLEEGKSGLVLIGL